jgi:acetyltransferase-like isoleucine patch superfamily enzyme
VAIPRSGAPEPSRFWTVTEFGIAFWARGYLRRRLGLLWTRWTHPRVSFGRLCDVRPPARFRVARGADTRFGNGCIIDHGFVAENRGYLEIGDRTVFGHHCTVAADESVVIGRHCLIGELVSIRDHDHAFSSATSPIIDQGRKTAPVEIGDNVWIGSKATVTAGVSIGANTVIGANAVVTGNLPENCVAGGIPAKVIRYREITGDTPDL